MLKDVKRYKRPQVVVFCGLGNNAGDGFVTARHLLNAGVRTQVYIVGSSQHLKNDVAVNYHILQRCGYPITEVAHFTKDIQREIKKAQVIVDALFGVGLSREIKGPFKSVIEALNRYAKRIVAIDVPSGLDGTTGQVYGICVQANKTVTFSFMKKGFLKKCARCFVGTVVVVDIGIPAKLKALV